MTDVWILGGARTPFAVWARGRRADGGRGGALKEQDVFDLGAAALKGALDKAETTPGAVRRVVFGNMYYEGSHGCYGSRYVALRAGVPVEAAAPTVSMACGSGLYALVSAAREVREGCEAVATGGVDCISRLRKEDFVPSFTDLACGKPIGRTVEELAPSYGFDRDAMDAWALRSHRLAREAQTAGRLAEEIVPLSGVHEDDAIQAEPSIEAIRASKSKRGGSVTAGNTHALVDGASSLILSTKPGGDPLGRLVSWAYLGVPPEKMGVASVPAVREALANGGMKVSDVDLFEINETFAGQMLMDMKELALPEEKVNVNGGAIAIGHCFAGTGCKLVLGLLLELKRRGLRRGVASICVGGGQGIAVLVERPS